MLSRHYHFIAIGGSIMHALAIALRTAGHEVSGSDDAIYGVSRVNLENAGILPDHEGWAPDKLDRRIDTVILGMHARKDNPELLRAQEMELEILSFPEFLYKWSANKKRVVIGGSHGKSTITAMCIHAMEAAGMDFDYIIGAPPAPGMPLARLSEAPVMIMEGDEYLTSPLDPTPKFLHYHHHIGLLSGIEWDHANVFPTEEDYRMQFLKYIELTPVNGKLVYNAVDLTVNELVSRCEVSSIGYGLPTYRLQDHKTVIELDGVDYTMEIFGEHNLLNLNGASRVCELLGIGRPEFFRSMQSFPGAGRRLQLMCEGVNRVFNDFAHSPSKVRATVKAVADQYPEQPVIAVLEIHTFSSLNKSFLPLYKDTLAPAAQAFVYYDPDVVAAKKLEQISRDEVQEFFGNGVTVLTSPVELERMLRELNLKRVNYLFMSSGNFGGMNLAELSNKLI